MLLHMDSDRTFYLLGCIPLNLVDEKLTGLDVLMRLVTSSCLENGYCSPEDISRRVNFVIS